MPEPVVITGNYEVGWEVLVNAPTAPVVVEGEGFRFGEADLEEQFTPATRTSEERSP